MTAQAFDSKDPLETLFYTLDFVNQLATGETIVSVASVAVTQKSGRVLDPTPGNMIDGINVVSGTKVSQLLSGGLDGNTYHLKICILSSTGEEICLAADVPICNI